MNEDTTVLRAILRQDWETYEALLADFQERGKGTPVGIIGSAFHLAARQRFSPSTEMSEIIRFVAEARVYLNDGRDLPPREAEILLCVNVGLEEPWMDAVVEALDLSMIAEIEGQLLVKLVVDADLTDAQLDAFLAESERLLTRWQEASVESE